jgi:hypothetical protein
MKKFIEKLLVNKEKKMIFLLLLTVLAETIAFSLKDTEYDIVSLVFMIIALVLLIIETFILIKGE